MGDYHQQNDSKATKELKHASLSASFASSFSSSASSASYALPPPAAAPGICARQTILGVNSPFFSTIVVSLCFFFFLKNQPCSKVSNGFQERMISGNNGEHTRTAIKHFCSSSQACPNPERQTCEMPMFGDFALEHRASASTVVHVPSFSQTHSLLKKHP